MAGTKVVLPLACFLALLCLSSSALDSPKSDFNILTLMWPGSVCNSIRRRPTCCRPLASEQPKLDFFVDALVTYSSATAQPVTNCTSPCPFYVNQLKNLIGDLNSYWPDVICPSNNGKDKWQAKWCTYGLCSNLTETDYFQRALQLRASIDPLFILGEFGIVPANGKTYSLEDIKSALLPSLGFSFYIECNSDYVFWFLEPQLHKIHVCVSADANRLISCPISEAGNCPDRVRFPPFTADMLYASGAEAVRMSTEGDVAM